MTVTYYDEYKHKKLCEVVLLGSHDAGIDKGNANTRTQTEGIGDQARKGARFFDLRIAAFSNRSGTVSMRAYHDDTKIKSRVSSLLTQKLKTGEDTTVKVGVKVHNNMLGAKGGGLYTMLAEARDFVSAGEGANEFLILKFDKSSNWPQITQACIETLRDKIYKPAGDKGNLNECTLEDLKGTVVVLFTKDGCQSCGLNHLERRRAGILQWKNLYDKKSSSVGQYEPNTFVGLQYYGKGGVSKSGSGRTGKIEMNARHQTELMQGQGSFKTKATKTAPSQRGTHVGVDASVVGVMYWTTTGASWGGIEKRNNKMWNQPNQRLLRDCTGLAQEMVPNHVDPTQAGNANTVKQFMPNIVMVDFVTEHQGRLVKALNTKSAVEINRVINEQAEAV